MIHANNKGADQTLWMRRQVSDLVACKPPEDRFSCIEVHVMSAHMSVLCTHMHENGIKM